MYDQDDDNEELPGTYEIYKAEADALFKNGDYRKAIESYTTALTLRPDDRISLVCRSKCHLMLGDTTNALKDAEASLAEDNKYHKGMFQKAEALYYEGDFEMALVFYHRGHRLRPELQEFRLGIQKAQEAIQNCVGTPDRVKLNTTGDLTFFQAQQEKKPKRKGVVAQQRPKTVPKRKRPQERSAQNEKTIRQMLGELYGDKQYLEKILKETDKFSTTGKKINSLAEEGLCYLDTRTEFWQQVKPMYARKYESRLAQNRGKVSKTSPHEYILGELEKIDQLMAEENFTASLKRAKKVMAILDGYSETQLGNKMTFRANVHSIQGNAYLELGDYDNAITQHQLDLSIGEDFNVEDAESRALDNLGRVYARKGSFEKAIELWERKLPSSKSTLETTWLCHELGRCYLELQQWRKAKDYGERSLAAAEDAQDDGWQLHALVLISQAEAKSGRLSSSLVNFEKALELATLSQDTVAEDAIKKAMSDLNVKIAQREQEGREDPDDDDGVTVTDSSAAPATESQPEPVKEPEPSPKQKEDKIKPKKDPTPQPSPRDPPREPSPIDPPQTQLDTSADGGTTKDTTVNKSSDEQESTEVTGQTSTYPDTTQEPTTTTEQHTPENTDRSGETTNDPDNTQRDIFE